MGMPANGSRIKQCQSPLQRCKTRTLWIPLIPADQRCNCTKLGLKRLETLITGRKVKLLVIGRIIGNVHLAVNTQATAVGIKNQNAIVVHPRCAALKKGRNQCHTMFPGKCAARLRCGSIQRLRKIKQCRVLTLTKVTGRKQFREANHLCPFPRSLSGHIQCMKAVDSRIIPHGHLHQPKGKHAIVSLFVHFHCLTFVQHFKSTYSGGMTI